ncbi:hypothetical protein GCM10020000_68910 [Streptomyces olivoverticillatus]
MKLFAKLFGKSARQDGGSARHRASRPVEGGEGSQGGRPLFRDQLGAPGAPGEDIPGGQGASSVDPATAGRIGFGAPATSSAGGGFALPVCTRCGHRNAEASRFCSNCGAPLRPGAVAERASETTSTISISGLEAYDSETTGQTPIPALSPEAQAAVDALPLGSALLVVRRGPNSGSRFLLDAEVTTAG